MRNQKGFGLLEMMITVGILSIVMMGTMQAITHAMLVSQTADVKSALSSLVTSTAGVAFNDATCTAAVTKTAQNYGQPFHFDDLHDGAPVPQYYVTVTSLTFANPALIVTGYEGTKIYRGTMTLVAKSNRQVYGPQTFAPRAIAAFYLRVDPSGKITGCGPTLPTLPTQPPPKEVSGIKRFDFDADPKVCENFPVKARCSDGQKIVVTGASYGTNCSGVPANFGQGTVEALCNGQASCDFTAGNINNCTSEGVFVDPAVNCPKDFHMSYYCQ